jgi:hypothetical protein
LLLLTQLWKVRSWIVLLLLLVILVGRLGGLRDRFGVRDGGGRVVLFLVVVIRTVLLGGVFVVGWFLCCWLGSSRSGRSVVVRDWYFRRTERWLFFVTGHSIVASG